MLIHNGRTSEITNAHTQWHRQMTQLIHWFHWYYSSRYSLFFCPIRSRFRFRIPLLFHLIFVCILHVFFLFTQTGPIEWNGQLLCVRVCVLVYYHFGKLVANCRAFLYTSTKVLRYILFESNDYMRLLFFSFIFLFPSLFSFAISFHSWFFFIFPFRSLISTIQLRGVSLILFSFSFSFLISFIFHGIFHYWLQI